MSELARVSDLAPPDRLDEEAKTAWRAVVSSLNPDRKVTHADMMRLEAGCRAWSRWRSLDGKIAEMSRDNPLLGEMSKSATGGLQVSSLRQAADAALREYEAFAREFGVTIGAADLGPSTDLFGYPDRPGRGKAGRPRFQPTARDHNKVRLLKALGWANPRIAEALEVSLPTLRKYFRKVLDVDVATMRDRLNARQIEVTAEAAFAGNMTAMKHLTTLIDRNDQMLAREKLTGDEPAEEPEEKLGKTEAARRAADRVASGEGSPRWGNLLKPNVYN